MFSTSYTDWAAKLATTLGERIARTRGSEEARSLLGLSGTPAPAENAMLWAVIAEVAKAVGGVLAGEVTVLAFAQSPYTVLETDRILLIDTSGGAVEVVLQAAAANGRTLRVKRTTTDGTLLTFNRNAKTIEGAAANVTDQRTQLSAYELVADAGGNWWVTNPGGQTLTTEIVS